MIRAILACDENWGIGKDGDLPWPKNSADLRWFKKCTEGSTVVMGRKTWESLPIKPLPNRNNIVVSKDVKNISAEHVIHPNDIKLSLMIQSMPIWIIGGAQLIESCLPIIDEIWLSRISGNYNCDTYLPRDLIELTYELYSSEWEDDVYVDKWRKY